MNCMLRTMMCCALGVATLISTAPADARLVVHGNRVIYPADSKEVTVRFRNTGDTATLAQIWVDEFTVDASPDDSRAPFVVLPPLVRVDGQKQQIVRLRYTGSALPDDRESVFWLNVFDAPPRDPNVRADQPHLQLAVRNRLKLFFRPASLKGQSASAAATALSWSIVQEGTGWALQVRNDSPFHVSTVLAEVHVDGKPVEAKGVTMIMPKSVRQFALPGLAMRPTAGEVSFRYISDHGTALQHRAPLLQP